MLVFFIKHCSFVNLDGITNIFVCCDTVRNNREERLNAFFSFFFEGTYFALAKNALQFPRRENSFYM